MMGVVLVTVCVLSACSSAKGPGDSLMGAAVPEQPRRVEYTLTADTTAAVEDAVAGATCLLRSGWQGAPDCRFDPTEALPCNFRTADEIAQRFRPVFDTLLRLRLTSPSVVKPQVTDLLPGAVATDEVHDARRAALCREWRQADGACLAVRYDALWILLHAPPPGDGAIDRVELFLAEDTCTEVE
jgi:hypothetical protein